MVSQACHPICSPVAGRRGHAAAPPARAWPVPPNRPPTYPSARAEGQRPGLGKAKLPKLKSPPAPSERRVSLRLSLCPSGSTTQSTAPRALGQSPGQLTGPPGPRAWMARLVCQYLLPPYVPSSGPAGLPLCPQAPYHHPRPPRTQPGQLWDQACTVGAVPVPPPRSGPAGTHRSLSLLLCPGNKLP